MRLARQRGDLTTVAGEARRLLASAVTADPARYDTARAALGGDLRALALIDLGIAEAWTARFDDANRHLDDGIALARQIGRPYLEVTGLAHLAQLESWRSFRLGAERPCRRSSWPRSTAGPMSRSPASPTWPSE